MTLVPSMGPEEPHALSDAEAGGRRLGAAVLAAGRTFLPRPLWVSANGVKASVLGGEEASLLVRCHCDTCIAAPPVVWLPDPCTSGADGAALGCETDPASGTCNGEGFGGDASGAVDCRPSCIHRLEDWCAHVDIRPASPGADWGAPATGCLGDETEQQQRLQRLQELAKTLSAGDSSDIRTHNRSLLDELRCRAALMGGGAATLGRPCWIFDALEAAAGPVPSIDEGRSDAASGLAPPTPDATAALPAENRAGRGSSRGESDRAAGWPGGWSPPEEAWVPACVAGWDEAGQMLMLSIEGIIIHTYLGASWLHWGPTPPAPGQPPVTSPPQPPLMAPRRPAPVPAAVRTTTATAAAARGTEAGRGDLFTMGEAPTSPTRVRRGRKRGHGGGGESSDEDWRPEVTRAPHRPGPLLHHPSTQPQQQPLQAQRQQQQPRQASAGGAAQAAAPIEDGEVLAVAPVDGEAAAPGPRLDPQGPLREVFTYMLREPRPIKGCHRTSIRLPRERFLDPAFAATDLPIQRLPVYLMLDGRLHGCSPRDPAYAILRSVIDPRSGKGCGELHGKMRRLVGDVLWKAALLGFSRVTRASDGADGLLLIAERREGLEEQEAAAAAARAQRKAELAAGGEEGQRPKAPRVPKRPASADLGAERPLKVTKRADRLAVTLDGASFWYQEGGKLLTELVLSSGWHLPRKWIRDNELAPPKVEDKYAPIAVRLMQLEGGGGGSGGNAAPGDAAGGGNGAGAASAVEAGADGGAAVEAAAAAAAAAAGGAAAERVGSDGSGAPDCTAPAAEGDAPAAAAGLKLGRDSPLLEPGGPNNAAPASGIVPDTTAAAPAAGGAVSSGAAGLPPRPPPVALPSPGAAGPPLAPPSAPAAPGPLSSPHPPRPPSSALSSPLTTPAPALPAVARAGGPWREVAAGTCKLTQGTHGKDVKLTPEVPLGKLQYKMQHRAWQDLARPYVGWYILGAAKRGPGAVDVYVRPPTEAEVEEQQQRAREEAEAAAAAKAAAAAEAAAAAAAGVAVAGAAAGVAAAPEAMQVDPQAAVVPGATAHEAPGHGSGAVQGQAQVPQLPGVGPPPAALLVPPAAPGVAAAPSPPPGAAAVAICGAVGRLAPRGTAPVAGRAKSPQQQQQQQQKHSGDNGAPLAAIADGQQGPPLAAEPHHGQQPAAPPPPPQQPAAPPPQQQQPAAPVPPPPQQQHQQQQAPPPPPPMLPAQQPVAVAPQSVAASVPDALRALAATLPDLTKVSPSDDAALRAAAVTARDGVWEVLKVLGADSAAKRRVLGAVGAAAQDPERRWGLVCISYPQLVGACAEGDPEWVWEELEGLQR